MRTTVRPLYAEPDRRLLVTSDIHAHAENFLRALQAADFGGDDVLMIVGDVVDKGPESLRTLRCVMRLAEKRTVYVSMGNVDAHQLSFLDDDTEEGGPRFARHIHRLARVWGAGLLLDMLCEAGIGPDEVQCANAVSVQQLLRRQFAPELAFMNDWPALCTLEDKIFVHGGIPTERVSLVVGTDASLWLRNDRFYTQGHRFGRCMCVGHWPVNLYREGREELNPLIDCERHIVCLDGGCGVEMAGQLNVAVFPRVDAPVEALGWTCADSLPTVTARAAQRETPMTLRLNSDSRAVDVLKLREDMALCRLRENGRIAELPAELLYSRDTWDRFVSAYVDSDLAVQPGELLHVVCRTSAGLYCKKDGVLGWYRGPWEEAPLPEAPAVETFL